MYVYQLKFGTSLPEYFELNAHQVAWSSTNPLELRVAPILSPLHQSSCTFFSSLVHQFTLGCLMARRHFSGNYVFTSTWTPVNMSRSCVRKVDAADSNRDPGLDTLFDSALFNVTTSDLLNFPLSKSTSIWQQANLNTRAATQYSEWNRPAGSLAISSSVWWTCAYHFAFFHWLCGLEELWAMYLHMARMCRKFLCVDKSQNLRARVKDRFKA